MYRHHILNSKNHKQTHIKGFTEKIYLTDPK